MYAQQIANGIHHLLQIAYSSDVLYVVNVTNGPQHERS